MAARPGLKKLAYVVTLLLLISGSLAQAQNNTVLSLAVPDNWRNNIITDELIAQFEAENPGVTLNIEYSNNNSTSTEDVETHLDNTAEYLSTADVVYVSRNSLTVESTRAGYFLNLAPLTSSDATLNTDDFYAPIWQSVQWDSGVWALPISAQISVVTYDAAAFDAAGLSYPTPSWTLEDFANAARTLTVYDSTGAVSVPGLTLSGGGGPGGGGGNNFVLFMRSLYGQGFYDPNTFPAEPQLTDPALEALLDRWVELETEGIVARQFNGDVDQTVPLNIGSITSLFQGFGQQQVVRSAAMLPGDIAGLDVQAFAVSAGTQYPELAYNLAKFLTYRAEVGNNFQSSTPARLSLQGTETQSANAGPGGGGPGGGFNQPASAEERAVIDAALPKALPASELRFDDYVTQAFNQMQSESVDAHTALENAQVTASANLQTAAARTGTTVLAVATPIPAPAMGSDEIVLNFGVSSGFGRGGFPNEEQWEQLARDFATSDPVIGQIVIEPASDNDLATLTETYDCFTLSNNAVPGSDLSTLLNIDPFLDTDTSLSRNDILGNTLAQVQRDNKTWALPLTIQPQMLRYNVDYFNMAGVALPENGWTVSDFINALTALKSVSGDSAPFIPNDQGGTYIMMLIAAFGGLPIDYRTDPVTINYTDTATVEAIRQVLDLAKQEYIEYTELGGAAFGGRGGFDPNATPALYSSNFNGFGGPGGGQGQQQTNTDGMTTYPTGSTYNALSYQITAGYISATAENPDACYRWLSQVANNPQLFTGMPVLRSQSSNPAVIAAQGASITALYNQIEALMLNPNTVIFPSQFRGGGAPTDFIQETWLKQAFDNYVLNDADLATELADAQAITTAYLQCVAALPPSTDASQDAQFAAFEGIANCASSADPDFNLGG